MKKYLYAWFVFSSLCSAAAPAYGQGNTATGAIVMRRNTRDHTPSALFLPEGSRIPAATAAAFLAGNLHPLPGQDELRLLRSDTPYTGITVSRYEQWLQGIKIEHASYTVTTRQGLITAAHGDFYNTSGVSLPARAGLSEAQALAYALQTIGAKRYAWEPGNDATGFWAATRLDQKPEGTLVWIENHASGIDDGNLRLAYKFTVPVAEPFDIAVIYIDANQGHTLYRTTNLQHIQGSGLSLYSGTLPLETTLSDGLYTLVDGTRGKGLYTYNADNRNSLAWRNFTDASNTAWSGAKVDVHWATALIYDYWRTQHNRSSFNGLDSPVRNFVHYRPEQSLPFQNAMWIGNGAVYGDGRGVAQGGYDPFVSLDICAHEFGHGISQSTARFLSGREPGTLNEGFSDIWAACIETWFNRSAAPGQEKQPWLMGEAIAPLPSRNMQYPKQRNQPDTYLGEFWRPSSSSDCPVPDDTNDNCGVHYNNGVLNRWFYLLAEGGSGINDNFSKYILPGTGIEKAARIAYLTELSLSPGATFFDCRIASIQAAKTLYGDCSAEFANVIRAWYAVGVGDNVIDCDPDPLPVSGVQELKEGIRVVQNPFRQNIRLRYHLHRSETVQVRLADASGRIVYQAAPRLPAGKGEYTLDLGSAWLSPGWYMLQMTTARQVFGEKLVKNE